MSINTILPVIFIPIVALFLVFSFVLSAYPEILTTLVERFSDIEKADEQGTGHWRLEQFKSYMPFIYDHPLTGMRLKGFDLPIQFYEPHTGLRPWADGTGHHFHSFYVDRLFYFGLVGLAFIIHMIYHVIRKILKKVVLSSEEMIFTSFVLSGVIYGFSYNWPTYFYFFIGIALGYIHKNYVESNFKVYEGHGEPGNKLVKYRSFKGVPN